jgi:type IV pilus modification protein PilV
MGGWKVNNRSGFTLIEVMVAMIILTVGVLGLISTSALVTRMIGRGNMTTKATQLAQTRLEILRQQALSTSPSCSTLGSSGTATGPSGMSEAWTVTTPAGITSLREFSVTVTYPITSGTRTATMKTQVRCP